MPPEDFTAHPARLVLHVLRVVLRSGEMKKPKIKFGPIMQVKQGKPYKIYLGKDGSTTEYDICCDCGLVHLTKYKPKKDHIRVTVWRDDKRTEQQRKRKQVVVVK